MPRAQMKPAATVKLGIDNFNADAKSISRSSITNEICSGLTEIWNSVWQPAFVFGRRKICLKQQHIEASGVSDEDSVQLDDDSQKKNKVINSLAKPERISPLLNTTNRTTFKKPRLRLLNILTMQMPVIIRTHNLCSLLATTLTLLTTMFLVMMSSILPMQVQAQVTWTHIAENVPNQLDIWTLKDRGCECPEDKTSKNCACCVQPGGCLCSLHYNKCAQCGLEDVCQRFCNVSISSWKIASKSGLSWFQIKSPSLQGPTSCWWKIESAPGQRIEVQIHRLTAVGSYDNSTQRCSRGFVQLSPGDTIVPSTQAVQLCGENTRFSPPIVMFVDQGYATLLMKLEARSTRSQLLAYVSFASADDPIVGDPTTGGQQQPSSTACDWTYDNCWTENKCILASPGYPGISPPFKKCRYFLSGNSTTNRIRLKFEVLYFNKHQRKCSTHHLAIWKSNQNTSSTPPWKLLCEQEDEELELPFTVDIDGTNHAILEYHSGHAISPFVFNGFRATVQFIQLSKEEKRKLAAAEEEIKVENVPLPPFNFLPPFVSNYYNINVLLPALTSTAAVVDVGRSFTTDAPPYEPEDILRRLITTTKTPEPNLYYRRYDELLVPAKPTVKNNVNLQSYVSEGVYPITCGHIFDGETTRGHVFRLLIPKDLTLRPIMSFGTYLNGNGGSVLKKVPSGPFKCQIEFRGRSTDIVQFAAFNYKFRGTNCSTSLEIYDMDIEKTFNSSNRLLGKMCGPSGNEVKRFTSSHSQMALLALIFPNEQLPFGTEFLEGAFRFHDETIEGTVKPMSSCEVVYYGVTSTASGIISGPPDSPLLLLSTYPLVCAYSFLPSLNQSVTLMINGAGHDTIAIALPNSMNYCRTKCGNSGCWCETKYTPLEQIDHLLLLSGVVLRPVGCFCGYFKDILPLSIESHVPMTLVYHATKGGREFSYSVGYQFKNKVTCANFTISPPSASKRWKEILGPSIQYNNRFNGNLHYTYFQCVWSISIPTRYKLVIQFISEENENDCRTWNLTLWTGNVHAIDPSPNDLLYTFCPKDGRKEFQLPETIQFAFLKLLGVTMRPPQFDIRWKYIDVMLGSGFLTERIITNNSPQCTTISLASSFILPLLILVQFILALSIRHVY